MERKGLAVAVLAFVIISLAVNQPIFIKADITENISLRLNVGERTRVYKLEYIYAGGDQPCAIYNISGDVESWFTVYKSGGETTLSGMSGIDIPPELENLITEYYRYSSEICLSKNNPKAFLYVYAKVPMDANEGNYSAKLTFFAAEGTVSEKGTITLNVSFTIINPKRIEAELKIVEVEALIDDAKSEGIKISDLESRYISAKDKMQYKQYSEVISEMTAIKSDITFRKTQYYQAKSDIEKATSDINELDKLLFASVEESKLLLSKAEVFFNAGNYSEVIEYVSETLKQVDAEKRIAEERKDIFLKVSAFSIIILLIIVILKNRKKAEIKEAIQESSLIPESPIVKSDVVSAPPPQEDKITKTDIQPIKIEEKKTIEKEKLEEEKLKDSTLRKLARQYADSEITKEEYEKLKKTLEDVM